MDCQLFHVIFRNKIKVMKREAWASPTTATSSCVCWPCTMQVSRHSYEEPNFFSFQFSPNDQTAETIFSSNIETWKSIDNSEFIELAGQCFSAKRFLVKFQERLEAEKNDLTDMFMKTVVYADKPTKSVPEIAASMLHSAAFCSFIKKQHDFYLQGMQQGLKVLLKQTDNCKRLMDVTDEELQLFGYNDETQESQRH